MADVCLLTGGSSPERYVALAGAAQVVAALRNIGHTVQVVDTTSGLVEHETAVLSPSVAREPPNADDLAELASKELGSRLLDVAAVARSDVVFLVLHGREGEGGDVQALLDAGGLRYTGSDPAGSARAMDKAATKTLLHDAGIPTAPWRMWPIDRDQIDTLGFPLIIKPSKAGSSVALSIVRSHVEVLPAVQQAQTIDDDVLLEQFVPGRELTVGILDGQALSVGELNPSHELFDYECKYTPGMTEEIFPAPIDEPLAERIRNAALRVHRLLALRDFSRVDFRLDAAGEPVCLEANTLPGLTGTSLFPQSAAAAGISFEEVCGRLVDLALRRTGRGNKVHR